LLASGADPERRTDRGDSALDIAQRTGNSEIAALLMAARKAR
jgi:ankyrin repeat protein